MSAVWTSRWMRCRDTARARRRFAVGPHVDQRGPQVALTVDGMDASLVLDPLQVGQLRAALRDAVLLANDIAAERAAAEAGAR